MAERKRLTTDFARKVPFSTNGGTTTYSDRELRGFYLRVNCRSKTWIAQRSVGGRQMRETLGRFPDLSAAEAREEARRALASMGQGDGPRRLRRAQGATFRDALDRHLRSGRLGARTRKDYQKEADRHLSDWMNRPMRDLGLDRAGVRRRHEQIRKRIERRWRGARDGVTTADYVMRMFRTIYNAARREDPTLPENPCVNVDFHAKKGRKPNLDPARLRQWGPAVVALENPVRRDVHLFMALSGMRRGATLNARAEDVDLDAAVLHVPAPKGGEARAFNLPLSRPLVDLLRYRLHENQILRRGTPWIFPAVRGKVGHVRELKEPGLGELGDLRGHVLRHLYASQAIEAGVPVSELKRLLNHADSGSDVTQLYIHLGLDHLRAWQERVSARILEVVGLRWTDGAWPPAEPPAAANQAANRNRL